jgi:hypothetical protein
MGGKLGVSFNVLATFALCHDGLVEATTEGFWKLENLVITIDLDGLLGGIHDHMAFVTPMKMFVEFFSQAGVSVSIKIIGQFV